ncbi:MAG: amino acid permease [Planctomycetes bacterium]|nr:amino acid permease [Planctomycetota bacterium]
MNEPKNGTESAPLTRTKFGTFGGVFTPSILTILGVIMFMRASFVIGNAGVLAAIGILIAAKAITFSTGLSLSAIGTNMQVRGGGAYFLISRVLGPEFGGAIGMALFLALALSVPFYILGFTEALLLSFPGAEPYQLIITLSTSGLILGVAYVGADWAIKTQFFIMGILVLAIVAFMGGAAMLFEVDRLKENLAPGYSPTPGGGTYSFWLIFAIYFPAVTGIDAGVNMSGDLEDPAKSLPRGTLAAVGVGFVVYLVQTILCGGAFARADLIAEPYGILKDNALFGMGFVVVAGVFAATLSSALGSSLGAPRVLQAVSRDNVLAFLRPFAMGAPGTDEPRRALGLTAVITVGILIWAEVSRRAGGQALNSVAAVITMFFLYTYGMMNLAAFIEAFGQNPSWRPRFKFFHWSIALAGTIGCVAATFLIDWRASIAAILLIAALLGYLKTRNFTGGYDDARRGFVFASLRKNLLRLSGMKEDSKNWRPTVLVFSGNPGSREALVSYGVWFEAKLGVVILANVIGGKLDAQHRNQAQKQLTTFCEERALQAVPLVMVSDDVGRGVEAVIQTAGLGPLQPNLVLFGWAIGSGRLGMLGRFLRTAAAMEKDCLLLKAGPDAPILPLREAAAEGKAKRRRIDVYWRGRQNGELMLLLAHLLTRNWEWSNSEIRVLRVVPNEAGREPALKALEDLIHEARVHARAAVIVSEQPFPQLLRETSEGAATVLLGFRIPDEESEAAWHKGVSGLLDDFQPTTVLVCSNHEQNLLTA